MLKLQHLLLRTAGAASLLTLDLLDALLFLALFAKDHILYLFNKDAPGKKPVESLRALLLALDLNTRWYVFQVYAGGHLVDILTAVPARTDEPFDQVLFADPELGHLFLKRLFFLRTHAEHK